MACSLLLFLSLIGIQGGSELVIFFVNPGRHLTFCVLDFGKYPVVLRIPNLLVLDDVMDQSAVSNRATPLFNTRRGSFSLKLLFISGLLT